MLKINVAAYITTRQLGSHRNNPQSLARLYIWLQDLIPALQICISYIPAKVHTQLWRYNLVNVLAIYAQIQNVFHDHLTVYAFKLPLSSLLLCLSRHIRVVAIVAMSLMLTGSYMSTNDNLLFISQTATPVATFALFHYNLYFNQTLHT